MIPSSKQAQQIKKAQKESALLRELAQLFLAITIDDPRLQALTLHRVRLSDDRSVCYLYFYTNDGEAQFQELFPILVCYKPSMRKALAHAIQARHTPELIFKYDAEFEKQRHVEELMDKLKEEGQL